MEKERGPTGDEDRAERGLVSSSPPETTPTASSDTEDSHQMATEKPESPVSTSDQHDGTSPATSEWDWATDPANPFNWTKRKKWLLISGTSMLGFTATLGSSIIAPATADLTAHFSISSQSVALLPLSLYVFALGLGPIIGGPLSETIGRRPILALAPPIGTLLALGAGFSPTLAGVCVLRFLSGLVYAPALAVPAAIVSEMFVPKERGPASTVYILFAFLGPAVGPVVGGYVTRYGGWQWTQFVLAMFGAVASVAVALFGRESYHPVLLRRHHRRHPQSAATPPPTKPPMSPSTLLRPLAMLALEPLVAVTSLFIATQFAMLYILFAAAPTIFAAAYHLDASAAGLTFISTIIGCLVGAFTLGLVDRIIYRGILIPRYSPHPVPPEHRLWAAMLSSWGPPAALFWFGWEAARAAETGGGSWVSPSAAMGFVAWGNLCSFVGVLQYLGDSYGGGTLASAASASSVARYGLAGALPLVAPILYRDLGIRWGTGLCAFVSLGLMPVPWVFWMVGRRVRGKSRFGALKG